MDDVVFAGAVTAEADTVGAYIAGADTAVGFAGIGFGIAAGESIVELS